jgi:hypothetical protein
LNTAGTQIDVRGGKLTFEIGKEKVKFDMFKALKYPANDGNFCRVDMIDVIVKEEFEKVSIFDLINKLVSHPSDGEFERFLEQLELDISKSKERRHEFGDTKQHIQQKIFRITDRRKNLRTAKSAKTGAGNSRAKIAVRSPKITDRNSAQLSPSQLQKFQTRPKPLQAHPKSN